MATLLCGIWRGHYNWLDFRPLFKQVFALNTISLAYLYIGESNLTNVIWPSGLPHDFSFLFHPIPPKMKIPTCSLVLDLFILGSGIGGDGKDDDTVELLTLLSSLELLMMLPWNWEGPPMVWEPPTLPLLETPISYGSGPVAWAPQPRGVACVA